MSLTAQITSALAGSLIVLAYEMPVLAFFMGHLRRLSAPLKPGQVNSTSALWIFLLMAWAAGALLAGMGITLALITYAVDYSDYTAAHICGMLVPFVGLFGAWLGRPDSDLSWIELFVAALPQLAGSVATLVFLWLGTDNGAYANYLPMGLYFALPVVHTCYVLMRFLEQTHVLKTRYLAKDSKKQKQETSASGPSDAEPLMMVYT